MSALVREHAGDDLALSPSPWPGGAALVRGDEAWVLAEDEPQRTLGRALAWARQQGAHRVNVAAEQATGVLARRAPYFVTPVTVWHVEGRVLLEAVPEPFSIAAALEPELLALAPLIEEGGATPVIEHGVLGGEVEGLEVCRAVRDPHTGACRLEVGVGIHDREAFQLMHGDVPPVAALAGVVASVAPHRAAGAAPHPLNRLAPERALRMRLLRDPALVGARTLQPAAPPVARVNVKDVVPCVAVGSASDGHPIVVVCSTGIDLDVVPFAADARAALGNDDAELLIAVPARDAVAATLALAAALVRPATVVPL